MDRDDEYKKGFFAGYQSGIDESEFVVDEVRSSFKANWWDGFWCGLSWSAVITAIIIFITKILFC